MTGSGFPTMVAAELASARNGHAPMPSSHHALGVITEEFEEFKDEVKRKQLVISAAVRELVQIASSCQRAAEDLGWVEPDTRARDRVAAYLYGTRWSVGQPGFQELPSSSRRQWLEQAQIVVDLLVAA